MSVVEKIEVRHLNVPLTTPYKLSFGTVRNFDTLIVSLTAADNRSGFGEATLLPGYTDETIEQSYALAVSLADQMTGRTIDEMKDMLRPLVKSNAFTATAFLTAIDLLQNHPLLTTPARVPLLAIISASGDKPEDLEEEIDTLLARGYGTLKFKVGFDPQTDIAAVANLQKANRGRARLRIDANQGYSADEAVLFLKSIDPQDIELVEQTCDKGDWQAAVTSKQAATVPIMLDESIYGTQDIARARTLDAADFIKLKLMKLGDLDSLSDALEMIRQEGMVPVLGNGVATDIGCWMEACVAGQVIDNAGEMNGFLKTGVSLLDPPLAVDGDTIVLGSEMPRLNRDQLERVTVRSHS